MDLPIPADCVVFAGFRLDRRAHRLYLEGNGSAPVVLGSRALAILELLVNRAGELVSKAEIISAVWPQMIVGEANLTVQIAALRRVLDGGRQPGSLIQTVSGRGYRFVGSLAVGPPSAGISAVPRAPRLSIVVLPFTNIGSDPEQQYFADAIVDDLTTDLSRIDDMLVIARSTAFTYRGQTVGARQIGHELRVRYVLEGSVLRSNGQIRLNVQLIDAETEVQLWADRFEGAAADMLGLQRAITNRIAVSLEVELITTEAQRGTQQPDAIDFILRGRAASWRAPTHEKYAEAIGFFERALALEPESVEAKSLLAGALANRALDRMSDAPATDLARAEALVAEALDAAPRNLSAQYARAEVLRVQRRHEEAIGAYQAAIAANRNLADAVAGLGWCKFWSGRIEEVVPLHEQAIRLSPRDPNIGYWHYRIGLVHMLQGRNAAAVSELQTARGHVPGLTFVHAVLAAAYALNGELTLAAAALAEARRLGRDDRLASIERLRVVPYLGPPAVYELFEKTLFLGLQKAGVPMRL